MELKIPSIVMFNMIVFIEYINTVKKGGMVMVGKMFILPVLSFMVTLSGASVALANNDKVVTPILQDSQTKSSEEAVHIEPEQNATSVKISSKAQRSQEMKIKKERKQRMEIDMASYKPVLKVLAHMMKELEGQECSGGQKRVEAIVELINELVRIHKEVELGSLEKHKQLTQLKKKADEKSRLLDLEKPDVFTLDGLKDTSKEVTDFFSTRQTVQTKTIGVNLFGELIPTVYAVTGGASVGYSKNRWGQRRLIILGNAGDGIGLGYFGTVGWNSVEMEQDDSGRLTSQKGQEMGRKGGCLGIGGGLGARSRTFGGFPHWSCPSGMNLTEMNLSRKNHIGEVGIGMGLFIGHSRFFGRQIPKGSCGRDYGYFMKNLGLSADVSKLSTSLC